MNLSITGNSRIRCWTLKVVEVEVKKWRWAHFPFSPLIKNLFTSRWPSTIKPCTYFIFFMLHKSSTHEWKYEKGGKRAKKIKTQVESIKKNFTNFAYFFFRMRERDTNFNYVVDCIYCYEISTFLWPSYSQHSHCGLESCQGRDWFTSSGGKRIFFCFFF